MWSSFRPVEPRTIIEGLLIAKVAFELLVPCCASDARGWEL